jgi:hypothetical protein
MSPPKFELIGSKSDVLLLGPAGMNMGEICMEVHISLLVVIDYICAGLVMCG